ncbi:FtsX-like permease family protein [Actinomadura meyerae]|uniref:FtsX-like permease family protein n=1 Tax=Actinomadura meyerae TaxID=240840 RepID=UPI001FEB52D0|nr:FtsX-like permease family protein [Actinomadura meyerae]
MSTLRHRRAAFAGGFVALFFAAALLTACGMLMDTGLRGHVAPERYASAPIIVSGDPDAHLVKDARKRKIKTKPNTARARIDASLTGRVRAVPGVRTAVPEVTVPAVIGGRPVDGLGWESAPLARATLVAGRAPAAAGEIVVPSSAGAAVGTDVTVLHPLGSGTYRVVGVTGRTPGNPAAFFGSGEAHRLTAARPGLTAIGVWPAPGASVAGTAEAVRAAVRGTGATVHTGTDRGRAEFPGSGSARTKLLSMGAALGGTSLIVAVLAVAGTFGLMLQQRERELAMLRAVAATPRQLRRMIGREAVLLGLAATLPGAAAGLVLGSRLHAAFADLDAIPANLPLVTGPFPPIVAVAGTVLAGWLAARLAARRITRLRPVEALGEAALEPPRVPWFRLVAGLAVLAGAVVLAVVLSSIHSEPGSGPLTPLTALAFAAAVGLLGPVAARLTILPVILPMRHAGAVAGLAAANLRAGARRLAAVIAPLTLMVALSSTLLFAETTLDEAAASQAGAGNVADYVAGPAVPGPAADALRKVPGVRTVTEVLHTRVRAAKTPYSAQGVTPAGLAQTMDLDVRAGSLDDLGDGTMAVREGIGMDVGDKATFAMADGTVVTLRVVAVYHRGLGFGDLTLPHSLVAAHVDVPMGTALIAAPGVGADALKSAVAAYPGLGLHARTDAPSRSGGSAVNYLALSMIVAFAAISAANTLAMATAGRVREMAMFRLAGGTRRQVLRMLRWETLTAVLVAAVLGTAIAYATLTAFNTGMVGSGGPHIPLTGLVAIVGAMGALAVLATTLPARLAMRRPPADALGARE